MLIISKKYHALFTAIIILSLSACETISEPVVEPTPAPEKVIPTYKRVELSAVPIKKPSFNTIKQAQARLKSIGYKIGSVDGIWGKRSEAAIKAFETDNTNGHLSELNLNLLTKLVPTIQTPSKAKQPITLSSQLNISKLHSKSAQLIIVEQAYSVLSKANPFSAVIKKLEPGAGIYILSQVNESWFEVETLENERGFIKAN